MKQAKEQVAEAEKTQKKNFRVGGYEFRTKEARDHWAKKLELQRDRSQAAMIKAKLVSVYASFNEIELCPENFGDTMIRDIQHRIKTDLECLISDFLYSDSYWENRIKEHNKQGPE